jgi:hypothetical protein
MATYVLLNNIEHKDLKVINRKSASFGDNVRGVITFPTEFRDVQSEYPIFFQKEENTGQFQAVAMFGFEEDQNLFLDEAGWHASYIPAVIARGPFLIGFQTEQQNGETVRTPVVHIDMDSPRISQTEGEAVFLPHGGNSNYLEQISRVLLTIHAGLDASKAMFDVFTQLDLIEPFTISIELNNGQNYQLAGNYTINEEKLYNLDSETLALLNNTGYLFSAYMVVASMSNVKKLIAKRNKLLA